MQDFQVKKQQVLAGGLTEFQSNVHAHALVCPGSGCPAPNWCRSAWTRNWTKRKCWRAGSPTSASRCRSPTTALCSTAARCRETPAARPATVTERCLLKQTLIFHLSFTRVYSSSTKWETPAAFPPRHALIHTKPYVIWHVNYCI